MAETAPIGIICGLASERQALGVLTEGRTLSVRISGARPAAAEAHARALVEAGCRLLVSWGLAGGLAPGLRPGDLIVPREVMAENGRAWPLRPPQGLADAIGAQTPERLVGVEQVVLDAHQKRALRAVSGAAAVDMETHRVAEAGAAAGVPVFALRAVSDPAERALPSFAPHALDAQGRPRILSALMGLLRRPSDLQAALDARRDSTIALSSLEGAAKALASV